MTTNTPTEPLDTIRPAVRAAVERSSLRSVAKEIGVSHSSLSGYIRDHDPTEPYGEGRRRLLAWAERHGVVALQSWGFRRLDAGASRVSEGLARHQLTDAGLKRIREHIREMADAGVDEARIIAAEELMRQNPLNVIRVRQREWSNADWIRDIDATWERIKEIFRDEGFDL